MITKNDCFYKIKGSTTNIHEYFYNNFNNMLWEEHESLWNLALIPTDILLQNSVLKKINENFTIEGAGFIKMNPEECYKWHVDYSRGAAINLLMNPEIYSLCLFEKETINDERIKYIELKYEPNQFYLFNTQINHSVLTFSETRYMFTLQFKLQKEDLNYFQIRNYLMGLTL